MIEERQIQEIVDKTDMVGLVSEFVTLTKRGKNYFGLCPFHDDSNPSFSVSPEKKIAKCMTCGEGGNPINFLKKIKNISFEEACIQLAERVGVHIESTNTHKKVDVNQKYYEINQIAQQFYQHFLHNSNSGKEALAYLHKRGLSLETIKMFGIGLAPKETDTLYKVLKDKGYSDIDIEDLGLAKSNKIGYYDMFNNRIMFPIIDDNNHVLGFSGRIYYQSDSEPKYVNTAETVIYKKGEMLYNLNNAIPTIRKTGTVILCEGQMDVIACTNAGIKNVICSLGTALTVEQVKLISKYARNVIIAYDGDNAGIKATKKAFELLKGLKVSSVTLPNGMDPDEFIKANGADRLKDFILKNQKDALDFVYDNAFIGRDLSLNYDYEAVKNEVFDFLKTLKSTTLVEKYLNRLSIDLKISYEAIFNDYNLYSTKGSRSNVVETTPVDDKTSKNILSHEKMFLALIIYNKDYFDYYKHELPNIEEYLEHPLTIQIYMTVSYFYQCGEDDQAKLIRYCYQEIKNDIIHELMNMMAKIASLSNEVIWQMITDSITRFMTLKYKSERKGFQITSNNATEEVVALMEKKLAFVRKNVKNQRK